MSHYAGEKFRAQDADNVDTAIAAIGANWTSYTPNWLSTGAGADPSLGNGILNARYVSIGKTLLWKLFLQWGSTTNGGSGDWEFILPLVSQNNLIVNVGSAITLDAGTAYKNDSAYNDPNSQIVRGLSIAVGGFYSATTPQTWAVNDRLYMDLILETV